MQEDFGTKVQSGPHKERRCQICECTRRAELRRALVVRPTLISAAVTGKIDGCGEIAL